MVQAVFEHANYSTADPVKTGQRLVDLFDWEIRWQGTAMATGYTAHVGTDTQDLALYSPAEPLANLWDPHGVKGAFNYIWTLRCRS